MPIVDFVGAFTLLVALAVMTLPLITPLSTALGASISLSYGVALFVLYCCVVRHPTIVVLLLLASMAGIAIGLTYLLTTPLCGDLASIMSLPVLSAAVGASVLPALSVS